MSSALKLKKYVELSQADYLKFHSMYNIMLTGTKDAGSAATGTPCARVQRRVPPRDIIAGLSSVCRL